MKNITRYQLDELQNNCFPEDLGRFACMSSAALAFMGSERSLLVADASARTDRKRAATSRRLATSQRAREAGNQRGGATGANARAASGSVGSGGSCPLLTGRGSSNLGDFDGGLELGWYGDFKQDSINTYGKLFDRAKRAADLKDYLNQYVKIGSFVVMLSAAGMACGGVKYKWVLNYHGVKLFIHGNPRGDIQPIRCRVGAVPLMLFGLKRVYSVIINILFAMGFRPMRELVSRVDFQIMMPDVSVSDFADIMQGGTVVTLARGKCSYIGNLSTGNLESITVHSSTAELCIYDKIAELLHNTEPGYFDAFLSRYCSSGELPQRLTRIEFRVRGESLRSFGICTVADLLSKSRGLAAYYCGVWFRILKRRKVAGMGQRQAVAPLWRRVSAEFHKIFCVYGCSSVQRRAAVRRQADAERLCKIAFGCLSKAICYLSTSFRSAVDECGEVLADIFRRAEPFIGQRVEDISKVLDVSGGFYD